MHVTEGRDPAAAPEPRLRAALDAVGLRYQVRATGKGSPYAGFRLAVAGLESIAMTAMIRGPVLQLAASGLRRGSADELDLRTANHFNRAWQLGCLYRNAEAGGWEAATSFYLGEDAAAPAALEHALAELQLVARLVCSARSLADIVSPKATEILDSAHLASVPRATAAGGSLLDVETALSIAGVRYRLADDGQRVLVHLIADEQLAFLVEFFKSDERFLHVRARKPDEQRVPDDISTFARMQQLNRGILMGAVMFAPEPPRLYHHAVLPLVWMKADSALVRWLLDHAAATLAAC